MPSPELNDFWWSTSQPGWSIGASPPHAIKLPILVSSVSDGKGLRFKTNPWKTYIECTVYRYMIYVYIQYLYSIHPPQRKGYIKRNLSHFRICPQKSTQEDIIYHWSPSIYETSIYRLSASPPPNQPGPTTRQVTLPRPRTFLWRLHRPDHQHQVTPY